MILLLLLSLLCASIQKYDILLLQKCRSVFKQPRPGRRSSSVGVYTVARRKLVNKLHFVCARVFFFYLFFTFFRVHEPWRRGRSTIALLIANGKRYTAAVHPFPIRENISQTIATRRRRCISSLRARGSICIFRLFFFFYLVFSLFSLRPSFSTQSVFHFGPRAQWLLRRAPPPPLYTAE